MNPVTQSEIDTPLGIAIARIKTAQDALHAGLRTHFLTHIEHAEQRLIEARHRAIQPDADWRCP